MISQGLDYQIFGEIECNPALIRSGVGETFIAWRTQEEIASGKRLAMAMENQPF